MNKYTLITNPLINEATYHEWYQRSLDDPTGFWGDRANEFITWSKPWHKVLSGDFNQLDVSWFEGAELNAAYNCLDRHLPTRAQQVAIYWQGNDPADTKAITYQMLYDDVCRMANVFKYFGVNKGDRVCIYLPMIPEAVIAMLACARIGAIHSVVFGGFSAEALRTRILDADCRLVITANEGVRGTKTIPLKQNVDEALSHVTSVRKVIVVKRTERPVPLNTHRDVWYHEIVDQVDTHCEPTTMQAQDPLFILYTSGSTGAPKGILHGTGGYLLYAAITHKYIFDYQEGDVYWCTADVGWVTGHTYSVYGPLANGATSVMFEGIPNYPTPARFWEIVDKYRVTIFYSAPTAIRALRREGDAWVKSTSRQSLRILGSVGEPINPDAWEWYYQIVGDSRCPIVDTWWQTETGGIMISAFPGSTPLKPGAAAWPFFGVVPSVVDDTGKPMAKNQMGNLLINRPWPGMMQTIYGNKERFAANYFEAFPGRYLTGDQAHCDQDGYYWISGRSDDVIKVSGHRIGTEEIESALISHTAVSEAAVVGVPDPIKGQHIYAFVSLKIGYVPNDKLREELNQTVRKMIGAIATPEYIQWADALPKTRSGKIMRRLLRKIANNDISDLGDTSTLADPEVIDELIREHALLKE